MATSGTYTFNLNRNEIFLMAYQETNILGEIDTTSDLTSAQITYANNKLNAMLKTWSIDGVKTPKRKVGYVFTQLGTKEYKLGSISGTAETTNSYVSTTLSAAEAAAQTVLSLTSTTGMTAADRIGIELDTGSRQWTTIVSVDSTTQVTVTDALTSAAASGNSVVSYTAKINKPLKILYGTRVDLTNNDTENELGVIGHDEYYTQPVKNTPGTPCNIYYDKQVIGTKPSYSSLFVYPQPNKVTDIIKVIYTDAIQDMVSGTDDVDLPVEWLEPVYICLAAKLAFSYGKMTEYEKLKPEADAMYELIKNASYDDEPITFKIKTGRR